MRVFMLPEMEMLDFIIVIIALVVVIIIKIIGIIGYKDRLLRNFIAFCRRMQKNPCGCDIALLYSPHHVMQSHNLTLSKDMFLKDLQAELKQ